MRNQTVFVTLCVCATVITTAAILAGAGPLIPPPGPIAPTPEIEPRIAVNATNTPGDDDNTASLFKITEPGSYYLTGNVAGVLQKHGIEIAASGVTLDLMGFELLGVLGAGDGVHVSVLVTNVHVRNGSIREWRDGVGADKASGSSLTDLRSSNNFRDGLVIGEGATVSGCTAESNTRFGILADAASAITNCTARLNEGEGIHARTGATISGCAAISNAGSGIIADDSSIITGCTSQFNNMTGIVIGAAGVINGCTARFNNDYGLYASDASTISESVSAANRKVGIFAPTSATIIGNIVVSNTGDGIQVDGESLVLNNNCDDNGRNGGGAGVRAIGTSNRIEGNLVTDNDRGIEVNTGGNLIVRNSASGNTGDNYAIAADNYYGPIIDRVLVGTAAVAGDSAPSTVATTDPWANFSY